MIKRYLNDKNYERFKKDFTFLFNMVEKWKGELDLRLRNNYFNLYFRGSSLAKVAFNTCDYEITIHKKFLKDTKNNQDIFKQDKRFYKPEPEESKDHKIFKLNNKMLHPFLQSKNLKKLCSNIKRVNYGEKIVFEHVLITDNLNREDLIIIDRQVTESGLKRKRLDLLALKRKKGNNYCFLVIEVKLGSNTELRGDVGEQLNGYKKHIGKHIKDWKRCYENNYHQMKGVGLIKTPRYESIIIGNNVEGLIVVGGYSGLAHESIVECTPVTGAFFQ
ncbi:MAG: hypothetical protein IEMM0002_1120 [bacterium]|nr:MAG: hypothetical protein IEMM0002_1120 [bacterium]